MKAMPSNISANTNDNAMNINRLEQTLSELQTVVLRPNSKPAANIRLKEILKRRALFGNQTVVLLTGSGDSSNLTHWSI